MLGKKAPLKIDPCNVNSLKFRSMRWMTYFHVCSFLLKIPCGALFWESLKKTQNHLLKKKKKTHNIKPKTNRRCRKKRRTEKENDRERTSVCVDDGGRKI